MDKKGWLILILCCIGLGANYWWTKHQREEWLKNNPQPAAAPANPNPNQNTATANPAAPGAAEAPSKGQLVNEPIAPAFEEKEFPVEWKDEAGKRSVRYVFTNRGGGLKRVEFPFDQLHEKGGGPVTLNRGSDYPVGALCDAIGHIESGEYKVVESNPQHVVLEGTTFGGIVARKEFTIKPGLPETMPLVGLSLSFTNPEGRAEASLASWSLLVGSIGPMLADESENLTGVAWYDGDKARFQSESAFKGGMFSSAKSALTGRAEKTGWFGVTNQFYAALAIPADPAPRDWWAQPITLSTPGRREGEAKEHTNARAAVGVGLGTIASGATLKSEWNLFFGPKHYAALKKTGLGVENIMLYSDMAIFGWVAGPFSKLLNWALHWLHAMVHDYGIAIIILTILIRLTIWPLYARSQRTMKRMSLLNPLMQEIKTKYESDPQKMNQEMMKLYRDYGVNPMGGCLPIFLQMPIFFGFYRMLQYAAELRHEQFLWVHDLSQPDTLFHVAGYPVNILPLLMGVTMVLQMRMTPQTGDPTQRRIFMLMPFFFLFICYSFASALSLYWTTQNIFSIGQTWLSKRQPEVKLEKRKPRTRRSLDDIRRQMSGQAPKDQKPKNRPPRTGG